MGMTPMKIVDGNFYEARAYSDNTSGKKWSTIINELKPTFDLLSTDEKRASLIQRGSMGGVFYWSSNNSYVNINSSNITYIDFGNVTCKHRNYSNIDVEIDDTNSAPTASYTYLLVLKK